MKRHLRHWNRFVRVWLATRTWVHLAWGMPAFLMAFFVVSVSVSALCQWTPESKTDRYLQAARVAVRQQEWKAADLYYEKVLQYSPRHATAVFELAKVASVLRQTARRDSLIQRLKTHDDPRKHLLVAELLAESTSPTDPADEAVRHLEIAESEGIDGKAVRQKLALRAFSRQCFATAIELLEKDEETRSPVSLLILAQSHLHVGDQPAARRAAQRLVQICAHAELSSSVKQLYRAQAYTVLGDFPRAIALFEAQRNSQNREAIEPYLGDTYAQWLTSLQRSSAPVTLAPAHLALLERGLALAPKHPTLLGAFLKFVREAPNAVLDEAFGRITSPTITHLALGMRALHRENSAQAAFHFELAQRSHHAAHAILNACAHHDAGDPLTIELLASVGVGDIAD